MAGHDSGGRGGAGRLSPNHGARRGGARADIVVLHYTGMASAGAALARLCDPASQVSAHYLIDLDGTVLALVPEARRAWHAGVARWGDVEDVNSRSIGIELAIRASAMRRIPSPSRRCCRARGAAGGDPGAPPHRAGAVVGHACVAPGRKADPGPRFDWRRLARVRPVGLAGAGPGPHRPRPPTRADRAARGRAAPVAPRAARAAARFGYPIAAEGGWDAGSSRRSGAPSPSGSALGAGGPGCGGGSRRIEALAALARGA